MEGKVIKNNSLTTRYKHSANEDAVKESRQGEKFRLFMLIGVAVLFMILIIVAWNMGRKHIALDDYIKISYTGADRYAAAECEVMKAELVEKLLDSDKDRSREYLYSQFADTIKGTVESVSETGISNGDRLTVKVSYDEELAQAAGLSVGNSEYNVRAKGISPGEKIDLFENIEVIFAGISPDAYLVTKNNWQDEFLSQLSYTADKSKNIIVDDEITLHCDVDEITLGRHGYITDSYNNVYKVDKLSTYAESTGQIDQVILKNLMKQCEQSIVKNTADTSFRMIYKATGNKKYLYEENQETAENITFLDSKFMVRSDNSKKELAKNKLVFIYSADIVCGGSGENIYFGYVYENVYVTTDGEFKVLEDEQRSGVYYCNVVYDDMMNEVLAGSEDNYSVQGLQINN